MKITWIAAALVCVAGLNSADAGFFRHHGKSDCCAPEPSCCAPAPAPSCCAPAPAPAAPSCCAPVAAAPSCCAPVVADCCGHNHGCKSKKNWFKDACGKFKHKKSNSCCAPAPSCCAPAAAPTCCAPAAAPTCSAPAAAPTCAVPAAACCN